MSTSTSASVNLIWAQTDSGVIGKDNTIPWHLPEDMRHFREITTGKTVIMGRKTWDSLPEQHRPLPGRTNIVISRQDGLVLDGAAVAASLDEAIALVPEGSEAWVIGGGQVYAEALPHANKIIVTYVDLNVDGDAKAPQFDGSWEIIDCEGWRTSTNGTRYRFATATRIGSEESKLNVCQR